MAWTAPWQLMGLIVSGDVSDLTIYTDRFMKKVPFPKSPPKEPASPLQIRQRAMFKAAQQAYMQLTSEAKQAWEDMSLKLSLTMTGQNAFIAAAFKQDDELLRTLEAQSGITLQPPPPVYM